MFATSASRRQRQKEVASALLDGTPKAHRQQPRRCANRLTSPPQSRSGSREHRRGSAPFILSRTPPSGFASWPSRHASWVSSLVVARGDSTGAWADPRQLGRCQTRERTGARSHQRGRRSTAGWKPCWLLAFVSASKRGKVDQTAAECQRVILLPGGKRSSRQFSSSPPDRYQRAPWSGSGCVKRSATRWWQARSDQHGCLLSRRLHAW